MLSLAAVCEWTGSQLVTGVAKKQSKLNVGFYKLSQRFARTATTPQREWQYVAVHSGSTA
jgi:hypothetical protein